ncbi:MULTISPECIES: exonuclease SbcCD subunit D [unclassified Pseudofrankia]|uniref:exonuclease SbcCD subunit D n=1 Tax=unclassified Pseudofrankia TaxID=2994372 RepID=UPI0008DA6719|nr:MULTISPECIES: exonuclease SbcCD subunit D [unclassified Pseudofrankia]MDT3445386.1 exonuclease SbcCD subunit D C-terminal domain-containing protein [Pseudofrankia sp. BMG5.37]OHV61277.1 exonuclease sbcCD subunit D [Pseudofrankia sp. BMG5.36]
MLVLHTSDWHLGRGLHGYDLAAAQAAFVDHLVEVARAERVGLVVVAGDVHDRAIPPLGALRLFDEALSRLRDTGARVVVISGNHDAPARLGDKAGLLDPRVRIRTDPAELATPVVVEDRFGPVRVYPIPYLEPAAVADLLPEVALPEVDAQGDGPAGLGAEAGAGAHAGAGFSAQADGPGGSSAPAGDAAGVPAGPPPLAVAEGPAEPPFPGMVSLFDDDELAPSLIPAPARPPAAAGRARRAEQLSHAATMRRAMAAVRADLAGHRGARSVVVAHAWVTGAAGSDSERDISVGGVAHVPASLFDGITYTALGHLHRPQRVQDREQVRYSGSPLAYSFSEAGDAKATLLAELGPAGLTRVEAIPVPTRRRMTILRGRLADLLTRLEYGEHADDFIAAVLTDPGRPMDAMTALRERFPRTLVLRHEPENAEAADTRSFARRTRGRADLDVAADFVGFARGTSATEAERELLATALTEARLAATAAEAG